MGFARRRRIVLGVVLVAGVGLLASWLLRPTRHASLQVEAPAAVIDTPARSPPEPVADTSASVPEPSAAQAQLGTLRGRVIDAATRSPVRAFELSLRMSARSQYPPEATKSFTTPDGRFAWQELAPGSRIVTVDAPGYQRFIAVDVAIDRNRATPEIVMPLLRGVAVRGRIYDEPSGAAIAGASVAFREADVDRFDENFRSRVSVTSADDGSFALDGVPPGRIILEVSARDYAGREVDVVAGEDTAPVDIPLAAGGRIAGRLTRADGAPLAGLAGIYSLDELYGHESRTGEAGEFSFDHLKEGRYQLTGEVDGASVTKEIVLSHNQRVEGIVLAVGGGATIRGVVTGLSADDLTRLTIRLQNDSVRFAPGAQARVDESGAYTLRGAQPGHARVVADVALRRQLSKEVDVPTGGDLTVNLEFPAGARLSGRVTTGGQPLAGAWLAPRPDVAGPVFFYGTTTSRDGQYVLDNLPAGDYVIAIGSYRSRVINLSGDTAFDIDVPRPQLAGRVLEAASEAPVVGADVAIWPANPDSTVSRLQDRSDHFGQFGLSGLEPGDFVLTAYKPGYEMVRERISYSSPKVDMTLRLRQEPGVEVRARDAATGKPIHEPMYMYERIGDRNGLQLQLSLSDDGVGYIPGALANSTLSFAAGEYAPVVIKDWNGARLDLRFDRPVVPR